VREILWFVRLLALSLLGACSFTPGLLGTGSDGGTPTGDGSSIADGPVDDSAVPPEPGFVRALDVVDARVDGGPHVDFPMLVSLTEPWLRDRGNAGDVARSDGFDIYFSADVAGTARLAHEVESYAPVSGLLVAWVKIPALSAGSVVYLHYGDPAITTSQQTVDAVWSNGYQLVMHLDAIDDATGKTASATFAATAVANVAGQIDRGRDFNGIDDRVDAGSGAALDNVFAAGGTAEAWFFASSYGQNSFGRLFDKGHTAGWSFAVNNGNATNTLAFVYGASTSFGEWNGPSDAVALDSWHHAAVVYTAATAANNPTLYIDGVALTGMNELVSPSGTIGSDASANLFVGNRQALDRTFDGLLDELRLSSVIRSDEWLLTQHRNQSAPDQFVTVSAPL
jgi:Concanavalin A-like lectin/glucanases superfamily